MARLRDNLQNEQDQEDLLSLMTSDFYSRCRKRDLKPHRMRSLVKDSRLDGLRPREGDLLYDDRRCRTTSLSCRLCLVCRSGLELCFLGLLMRGAELLSRLKGLGLCLLEPRYLSTGLGLYLRGLLPRDLSLFCFDESTLGTLRLSLLGWSGRSRSS